jgi:hypothetical protein
MKEMLIIVALTAACLSTANAGNIHTREIRQQRRIAEGIRTGNLTPNEAARLENREAALHREIRRDRLDGPGLSLNERKKIARQQNRISNHIYRESHDRQARYSHSL